MVKINFPFSAIIGQDRMKLALIINIIDPKIGGVLLYGQQGTGKSTTIRSILNILPDIQVFPKCEYNCNPLDEENLCEFCQHQRITSNISYTQTPLVNVPIGVTEEMVLGSIDIEQLISAGKKKIYPGLLAKSHRGILYIDEINLLSDHIIDLLLDVSSSGFNIIEREGISYIHPSSFILIGSMNPEEGELRPQIFDRFGIKIEIKAPQNASIRAEITKRVINFNENPEQFLISYEKEEQNLKKKILNTRANIDKVQIPLTTYRFIGIFVQRLGFKSQRIDITFMRCARALAAYENKFLIDKEILFQAASLVFEGRLSRLDFENLDEYLGTTFNEVWNEVPEAIEDLSKYKPSSIDSQTAQIFKSSPEIQDQFKNNPLKSEHDELPEVEEGHRNSKDKYSNYNDEAFDSDGFKVGNIDSYQKKIQINPDQLQSYEVINPLKIDLKKILGNEKRDLNIVNYTGRGSRVRVLSYSSGRMVYARVPKKKVHCISFTTSIKQHYINFPSSLERVKTIIYHNTPEFSKELAVKLNFIDLREKINELHAPLYLYFIVDASASMRRTLDHVIKVIQSVHAEGYKKKDKVAVISFQGKESQILQRPSVTFSVGLHLLKKLEATSYTPLASALKKTFTLIQQEQIKGLNIPVIIILSDLGANVSLKHPDINARSRNDFGLIADELEDVTKSIGNKGFLTVVMKPKKSFATRYLGVDPYSVQRIEKAFLEKANAKIFEFDAYSADISSFHLNRILDHARQ